MLVGYACVSTADRHRGLQCDVLTQAGCGRVFTDTASGTTSEPHGLTAALNYLKAGDVLAVGKLDRLGRSLKDLREIVIALERRGIGLKSLQASDDVNPINGGART